MSALTETVKRMLNALAHADAGEFLTPLQKTNHIIQGAGLSVSHPVATCDEPQVTTRQQVALYMGSELSPDVMNYVIQTCARLKHGLTVLTFQQDVTARAMLSPYLGSLKSSGICMQMVTLTGEPISGLARYLRRHPEVAFLTCNETGYLGRSLLNGTQRKSALPVPVVLVEAHASRTQRKDQDAQAPAAGAHHVA